MVVSEAHVSHVVFIIRFVTFCLTGVGDFRLLHTTPTARLQALACHGHGMAQRQPTMASAQITPAIQRPPTPPHALSDEERVDVDVTSVVDSPHVFDVAAFDLQGRRVTMEDRHVIMTEPAVNRMYSFPDGKKRSFFAVRHHEMWRHTSCVFARACVCVSLHI